ncbi:MAG: hypothetical protein OQJ84_12655 [Xanthomonadales bacterium]|nr:hypothetical protein [Xanthomonadales bacterium]
MNIIAKLTLAFTFCLPIAGQTGSNETDGVALRALNCKIQIPDGYVISVNNVGNLQALYFGADHSLYPNIQYYPNSNFETYVSENNIAFVMLSEEKLGPFRFLKTRIQLNGQKADWDVVASDSAFFALNAVGNTGFLNQFRACATKIANKSSNPDASDAGVG